MYFKLKKRYLLPLLFLFFVVIIYTIIKPNRTLDGVLILSGRIEGKEINVSSKIQGRIAKLYKDEGDAVKQEELLCEIDSDQLNARYKAFAETAQAYYLSIAQAQANLRKAQASYDKVKTDYDRYSVLIKEELVSKSDFDKVKMQYESAKAEVDAAVKAITQAEANYRAAKQKLMEAYADLKETKIYAPIAGVILSRPVEIGEVVNPGTVLYILVDLKKLYVKVYVPEPDIGKLKLGLPARVYIDAYPDRFFNGKVTKIYEQAEFTPKSVETKQERVKLVFGVEVSVENPEELLKPGMPADVIIKWKDNAEWIKP